VAEILPSSVQTIFKKSDNISYHYERCLFQKRKYQTGQDFELIGMSRGKKANSRVISVTILIISEYSYATQQI